MTRHAVAQAGRGTQVGAGRTGRTRGWACWALGRPAMGRAGRAGSRSAGAGRSAGGQAAARVAGAGMGARGTGRERAERTAWVCGARCLGVPVRAGWACWLVSWASFGAQCTWLSFDSVFDRFDSVFFLSH